MDHTQQHNVGYDSTQQQQQQPKPSLPNSNASRNVRKPKPYVKIIEQPAGKALRFRYECEGRSAGSIPGVNSTSENKTYPTIEIVGYKGRAVVVVSCVTKDEPYRPHPHNLVGKEGCKKGVCTIEINSETMRTVFSNLGIQCVKKKDIEAALKAREEIRVDPFKTGFQHRFQPSGIDLNSVRLCFQVFMEGEQKGRFTQPLPPVVSEPIYDKKAMSDLVICRLCSCSASVLGNNQIILLCEKVAKEDISIRFFEEKDDQVIWEGYGDFQHTDVHKQTAITFKTPRYHKLDITEPAKVFIQLKRPSDGVTSEALPFQYIPLDSGRHRFWDLRRNLKRKPDLDIFQQILNVDREIQQTAVTSSEIIDLNTPTGEEEKNLQNNLSDIETTLTLTNDPKHTVTEDRNSLEIDSIIEEKIRELEQQQIKTETSINPSLEFATNITQDEAKAAFEMNPSATGEIPSFTITDKINEWMKSNENNQKETNGPLPTDNNEEDKTLDEILEQVAELDEIYSDRVTRRDTYNNALLNELNDMDTCIATEASRNLVDGSQTAMEIDENFDDAATYTSLQIAFKNPITIPMDDLIPETMTEVAQHYDPVEVRNSPVTDSIRIQNAQPLQGPPRPPAPTKFTSPFMHVTAAEEEKVPPLPPKRLRKQDSNAENRSIEANIGDTSNRPQRQAPPSIIIMKTPDQSPPTKRLPPKPDANNYNTLPKQKKPGFFSKLFSRRKSKSDLNSASDQVISKTGSKTATPADSRESSLGNFHLNDPHRSSIRSAKSLQPSSLPTSPLGKANKVGKPVGRSVSSVSGKRPAHLNADVIHIPLKGDSTNSLPQQEDYSKASTLTLSNTLDRKTVSALQLADIPICEGNMELVAIADRQSLRNLCEGEYNVQIDPDVDLTEAEHFALYTSVPPQATVSEFDETSAYYAAVDGGEILTPEELAERLVAANHPAYLKRKRQKSNGDPIYTLLSQQPKSQHQHDQLDARRGSITSWNQSKKPVIKTEPRDTSPQPFNLYHAQHEVTQSPHSPLSPCCNYNQPSPYGVVSTTTALPIIPQVIGQYKTSPNSAGAPCRPSPNNNLHEYNVFNQQTQHTTSNFTGTSQWESKFSPNIINNNDTIGNDATQFRIYNALTAGLSNANANRTDGNCVETVPHANWPLPPANLYAQMHHYQATPVVVPPCNVEQMQTNNNNQPNHNNSEQGLSNLLNFDSTQLVRIDTEDQQMLQLNTEDLQISNLSIST